MDVIVLILNYINAIGILSVWHKILLLIKAAHIKIQCIGLSGGI